MLLVLPGQQKVDGCHAPLVGAHGEQVVADCHVVVGREVEEHFRSRQSVGDVEPHEEVDEAGVAVHQQIRLHLVGGVDPEGRVHQLSVPLDVAFRVEREFFLAYDGDTVARIAVAEVYLSIETHVTHIVREIVERAGGAELHFSAARGGSPRNVDADHCSGVDRQVGHDSHCHHRSYRIGHHDLGRVVEIDERHDIAKHSAG